MPCSSGVSRSAFRWPISPIGRFLPASNSMWMSASWCRARPSRNSFCSVSSPGSNPRRVRRILDVGTGSGAIALACAMAFPTARVDAVDVSAAALQVARRNRRRLRLQKRVSMLQSDHFDAVEGRR